MAGASAPASAARIAPCAATTGSPSLFLSLLPAVLRDQVDRYALVNAWRHSDAVMKPLMSDIMPKFRITLNDGRDLLVLFGLLEEESSTLVYVDQMHDPALRRIVPGEACAVLHEQLDAKGAPLLLTCRLTSPRTCFVVSVTSGEIVSQCSGVPQHMEGWPLRVRLTS